MSETIHRGREFSTEREEVNFYRDLAMRDPKTGLGSEHLLNEWQEYNYQPKSRAYLFAFIDIENFKSFNDAHGQAAGDALIGEFGASLRKLYRAAREEVDGLSDERADPDQHDIIARVGGDEALICYDLDHLSGDALFNAVDVILTRLKQYRLIDPKTQESFTIRAAFELSIPDHPIELADVRESLSDKMVDLKLYQKAGGKVLA